MKKALTLSAVPLIVLGGLSFTLLVGGAGNSSATPSCVAATAPVSAAATSSAMVKLLPASVGPYKGEQILNAAHIIKAGQGLNLSAHGLTIAVMTAIGESSLTNITHGDDAGPDSRGLFQQRANGAWGSAGDRMNPTIAATNFFKALLRTDGWQALPPTISAHQVQGNADPYHYEPYWPAAVKVVSVLTANPNLLKQLPSGGGETPCDNGGIPLPGNGIGEKAYNAALTQLAVPYSWGGGGQGGPSLGFAQGANTMGFDCSSLAQYAYYTAAGKALPRTSEQQMATLPRVPTGQLQAGDLIFFHNASHVAISDGHGGFVHSPETGGVVSTVQNWQANPYWADGVDGAARPTA
jgi:cell wall-associated NlpC family hydrolase